MYLIYKQLLEKISEAQLWLDDAWLRKQVAKGRLGEPEYTIMKEMMEVLEETFPGAWSFRVFHDRGVRRRFYRNPYGGGMGEVREWKIVLSFSPIIKFSGTIKNSLGEEHFIRDLYVILPISWNRNIPRISISNPEGSRGVLTVQEAMRHYQHSHLKTRAVHNNPYVMQFGGFCLGTGEIVQMLRDFSNNLWDKDAFRQLLYMLQVFVFWESVEGLPYIYMRYVNLSGNSISRLPYNKILEAGRTIIKSNREGARRLQLTWLIEGEKYIIVDDEVFDTYCKYAGDNIEDYEESLICNRNESGEDVPIADVPKKPSDFRVDNTSYFYFRGEKITLTIIDPEEQSRTTPPFYIKKEIKQYVKETLQRRAKRTIYPGLPETRAHAIRRLSGSNNAPRSAQQD